MNRAFAEEMLGKFSELLSRSPAKDFEANAKVWLKSLLARMDLVERQELEILRETVARHELRLATLENRLAELEATAPAQSPRTS